MHDFVKIGLTSRSKSILLLAGAGILERSGDLLAPSAIAARNRAAKAALPFWKREWWDRRSDIVIGCYFRKGAGVVSGVFKISPPVKLPRVPSDPPSDDRSDVQL